MLLGDEAYQIEVRFLIYRFVEWQEQAERGGKGAERNYQDG